MKNLTHYFADTVKNNGTTSDISENGLLEIDCSSEEGIVMRNSEELLKKIVSKTRSQGKSSKSKNLIRYTDKKDEYLNSEKIKEESNSTNKRSKQSKKRKENKKHEVIKLKSLDTVTPTVDILELPKKNDDIVVTITVSDEEESERVESNAFQVLMTKSKPIQYISPAKVSLSDTDIQNISSVKNKLKSNKEKLIVLADKKGYSKRKSAELEEGEKIERAIDNRIKIFKNNTKRSSSEEGCINKSSPSNLLNYFSKTQLDPIAKDNLKSSKLIVEAEVHTPETSVKKSICPEVLKQITHQRIKKNKNRSNSLPDDVNSIQVLYSEDISSDENSNISKEKIQSAKPRWSLRIKLQQSEEEKIAEKKVSVNNETLARGNTRNSKSTSNSETKEKNVTSQSKSLVNGNIDRRKSSTNKTANERKKMKTNESENILNPSIQSLNRENMKMKEPNNTALLQSTKNNVNIKSNGITLLNNSNKKITNNSNSGEKLMKAINDIDKSVINENGKRKCAEKLAPLFTKKLKADPAAVAARRLFLQSDLPEENSKISRKPITPISNILPFPSISHINQINNDSFNYESMNGKFVSTKPEHNFIPSFSLEQYKLVNNFNKKRLQHSSLKFIKSNIEEVLTDMEKECPEVRDMWKYFSCDRTESPKISPKSKSRRRKIDKKETISSDKKEDKYDIWTEKYKPLCASQVIGNEDASLKLRNWLLGWRSTKNGEDSSEEFYSSDCSMNINENNQVAVLLGPYGCGKTASVYAVAKELGYSVLEVNASSRRTGKKILKDFEEATKSHRVKKENSNVLHMPIPGEFTSKKIAQNSLILFEDVDIIFEEDDGFASATYQLATNTKRPIVMTCRDTCQHLIKLAPQQLKIFYHSITDNRASTMLNLISLAETGHRLPSDFLIELLQSGDLRKALLQLQYVSLSKQLHVFIEPLHKRESFWRDMRQILYKPAIKQQKKNKKLEKTDNNVMNIFSALTRNLNCVKLMSQLIEIKDVALNMSYIEPHASLSLSENTECYSSLNDLSDEIVEWIGEKLTKKEQIANSSTIQNQNYMLLRKQVKRGVDLALSYVAPNLLDRRAVSVDYLPSVRTICRAEENRSSSNLKRGNRFFHYLHGLKLPSTSTKPNILAAACKTMQDKDSNNIVENLQNLT